jgi:hypothetical protein
MVSKRLIREAGHRRKFLAIIDETPECERAVAYASRRAKNTNGVLVLLYVIEPGDFQHWLGVEKIMREEAQAAAAAALDGFATKVRQSLGIEPELVVARASRRGNPQADRGTRRSPSVLPPALPRKARTTGRIDRRQGRAFRSCDRRAAESERRGNRQPGLS